MIKVDTAVLSARETELRTLAGQLEQVCGKLSGANSRLSWTVALSTQVRSSVGRCAGNVSKLSDKANALASGLQEISGYYQRTENENSGNTAAIQTDKTMESSGSTSGQTSKGKSNAEDSSEGFSWWTLNDTWSLISEAGIAGSILAMVGKPLTGGTPNGKTALTFFKDATKVVGNIAKAVPESGASFDWKTLIGLKSTIKIGEQTNWWKNVTETTDELMHPGRATSAGKKVATYAKWAGYALTLATTAYDNFTDTTENNSTGRKVAETVGETAVKIGEGIAIGAAVTAVAASIGVAAPAVVIGGVTVMATWAIDKVFEATTGKDAAEFISDTVLDAGEKIISSVGEGAKKLAGTISGWWQKAFG